MKSLKDHHKIRSLFFNNRICLFDFCLRFSKMSKQQDFKHFRLTNIFFIWIHMISGLINENKHSAPPLPFKNRGSYRGTAWMLKFQSISTNKNALAMQK